jgi:ABC-2 type transport system permease protein
MAGLSFSPGMRGQFAAIARVRWQLFVNGLRTVRGRLEIVARGFMFLGFAAAGLVGSLALGWLGWLFISRGRLPWLPVLLWFVFLFWQLFPVMATAFTETVDSSSLLRFPLSFPSYFMVRLVYGALEPSTFIGSFWLLGLAVGIGIADSRCFLWAAIVLLAFAIFNILLARMIFAWVERWLAQRRTREIIGVVFFIFIICFQFVGPLMSRIGRHGHSDVSRITTQVLPYERVFPPGLAAAAISRAVQGAFAPALAAFALECVYALAILWLLNIRLRAQYHGENLSEALARSTLPKEKRAVRFGWNVSGIPGPVAAVFEKEFHYLSRSGPMLFTFVMPVVILLIFRLGPQTSAKQGNFLAHAPDLAFPVGSAYALLILTNLVYNCFGADAVGMQFFFVSPVSFREILLGKNLAHALVLACEVVITWIAVCFMFHPPAVDVTFATVTGVAFALLLNLTAGNLLSIYTPKKIDYAAFGKQRASTTTVFASLGIQAAVFALAAVTLLIARAFGRVWIAGVVFSILAGLASVAYVLVLNRADRIALDRRDAILAELCRA